MTWHIIGHERAVRMLRRAVETDTPAHAYLITGPQQVGKRTLARELAAALNCEAAPSERPCHGCRVCRMIEKEAHPDFIVVESARDRRADDREKHIDRIREARGSAAFRPYEARYKVYLFADAEEMSEAAANVLLKTLEEPPPQVVLILTAEQAESVPSTVQSRCREIPLQALRAPEISAGLRALHGADAEEAARLAALAGGQVGWAIAALAAPEQVRQREQRVEMAVSLSDGRYSTRLLQAAEACKGETFNDKREACLRVLEDMRVWWRDQLLAITDAGVPLAHEDRRAELLRQAESRGAARIARGLREIELTAGAVERNVTPQLALEALVLRLSNDWLSNG